MSSNKSGASDPMDQLRAVIDPAHLSVYKNLKLGGVGLTAVGMGLWNGAKMASIGKPVALIGAIVTVAGGGAEFLADSRPKTG